MYLSPGQYTVTLKVTDNSGMSYISSQIITITPTTVALEENLIDFLQTNRTTIIVLLASVIILGFLFVYRKKIQNFLLQRDIGTSQRKLTQFDRNAVDIDALVEALFLERKRKPEIPTKETILDAYNDLIIGKIEKNISFQLPDLCINEVEILVDRRLQKKIEAKVDKL